VLVSAILLCQAIATVFLFLAPWLCVRSDDPNAVLRLEPLPVSLYWTVKSIKPRGSRRSVDEPTIPSPSLFASRCVDSRCLHCPNLAEQAENDISSVGAYMDYAKLGDKTLPSQHVVNVIGHDVVHHV
jgi:hypothetical protein